VARLLLILLDAVIALNAIGGAIYGLSGAKDVPREWLEGSPFDSFLIPSLYLGIIVGGAHMLAAALLVRRDRRGRNMALAAAAILASWIAVQVAIIGYVSFLQPAMFVAAVAAAGLAMMLRDGRNRPRT
jgi:hypothetical protein